MQSVVTAKVLVSKATRSVNSFRKIFDAPYPRPRHPYDSPSFDLCSIKTGKWYQRTSLMSGSETPTTTLAQNGVQRQVGGTV
jgi:hypothetical protein